MTCTSETAGIIEKAAAGGVLGKGELVRLLTLTRPEETTALFQAADEVRRSCVGDEIFLRGIIEFSGHCRRNCHYCGLRAGNRDVRRYRMTEDEIVSRARVLEEKLCTTVVLQSGEDPFYDKERVCSIIRRVRGETSLAITLSIGERPFKDYEAFRDAGADRYLLRHETSSPGLYRALHPGHELAGRVACLRWLRQLGYEVGSGCMVGLPGQTADALAEDVLLMRDLDIDMIGIGPFIPHPNTPLGGHPAGDAGLVLRMIAVLRLVTRDTNIPATTALGVLHPGARRQAFTAGANVFMPNFTPEPYTSSYEIYPGKGPEAGAIAKASEGGYAALFAGLGRTIGTGCGYRVRTSGGCAGTPGPGGGA